MSHVTAGFEYDETLGRLQFVSNILPESAMVFLTGDDDDKHARRFCRRKQNCFMHGARMNHGLNTKETAEISCCMAGEVMNTVKNRQNEYTVRILHPNGL